MGVILVDTSVWIDFFRGREKALPLQKLLDENRVALHSWVFGELLLGQLGTQRTEILKSLDQLPSPPVSSLQELRDFLDEEKLAGSGLSLIDLQLLHTTLAEQQILWTFDKILARYAKRCNILFEP